MAQYSWYCSAERDESRSPSVDGTLDMEDSMRISTCVNNPLITFFSYEAISKITDAASALDGTVADVFTA